MYRKDPSERGIDSHIGGIGFQSRARVTRRELLVMSSAQSWRSWAASHSILLRSATDDEGGDNAWLVHVWKSIIHISNIQRHIIRCHQLLFISHHTRFTHVYDFLPAVLADIAGITTYYHTADIARDWNNKSISKSKNIMRARL